MGCKWTKPKHIYIDPRPINKTKPVAAKNPPYNYVECLKKVLDSLYHKYIRPNKDSEMIERTGTKRPISKSHEDGLPSKYLREEMSVPEVKFFTDKYTLDELEEFLSSCTNSPPPPDFSDDEDLQTSLYDKLLSESNIDFEELSNYDLEDLLKEKKILLKFAEKKEYIEKLVGILKEARKRRMISDVIDLTDENKNSAMAIAILNQNLCAFHYLMDKCQANVPLFLYDKNSETPFLMYIAKNGKIQKNKENSLSQSFILLFVLKYLLKNYSESQLLPYLTEIDKDTQLSLPHFLIYVYEKSVELRPDIIECFKLCIKECPSCTNVMCVNYYDPRYTWNVIANCLSNPVIEIDKNEELKTEIRKSLNDNDKRFLRELVEVHQNKQRKENLLTIIG